MSLKTEHRPTAVRGSLLFLILGATLVLALWSRAVYQPRRDSGHMLIITSAVVLLGSAVHTCLCAVPWLCAVVAARARAPFCLAGGGARHARDCATRVLGALGAP